MTLPDSTLNNGTQVEPPTPPAPSANQNTPPSATVTVPKEQFEALVRKVDTLSKGAQSEKDRAVRRLEGDFSKLRDDLKPVLERATQLMSEGKSADEALTQVQSEQDDAEFKQNVREIATGIRSGTLPNNTQAGQLQGDDMTATLQQYKLDGNDAQVNTILSKPIGRTEKELELAKLAFNRATIPPPPPLSPSGGQQQSSGGMSDDEAESLYSQLGKLILNPTVNKVLIAQVEGKLKAAGRPL